MAKRNNRVDFDDFDDFTPSGNSSYGAAGTYPTRDSDDDDDWAGDSRREKQHKSRRGGRIRIKPWMPAVAVIVLIVLSSLLTLLPEPKEEPPHSVGAVTLPQDIEPMPTQTQIPPATEPDLPQPTEPSVPPMTQPPATEPVLPPVTQPPATEPVVPPVTQPPATEPTVPETTEPQATGIQLMLQQEAQILEDKYGITILVGEECKTEYGDYTASITTDYNEVMQELNMLDYVLGRYPEGFFRQLCDSYWTSIRIYLISDLWAHGETVKGDGYAGFGGTESDYFIVVLDIDDTYEGLYYHEFMHMIDNYLAWDAGQRPDALYSAETWDSLNPDWFPGYFNDYSNLPNLVEDDWFVDSYGAINALEDRAQLMARAMLRDGEDYFASRPGIRLKLDYLSRCIRDAFDTTGWPETLAWEQYLYG